MIKAPKTLFYVWLTRFVERMQQAGIGG